MKVFLDTAPLYGLLDARDQYHQRALAIFGGAQKAGDTLLCPLPTALELHGLLVKRKPSDPGAAHKALRGVVAAYLPVFPTQANTDAATELLARFGDQRITLTDALLASMAVQGDARVLTFDVRHFVLMGVVLHRA